MIFGLSLQTGWPVEEIMARPVAWYACWAEFHRRHPFGPWRDDYRAAALTDGVGECTRAMGGKPTPATRRFPELRGTPKSNAEAVKSWASSLCPAASGPAGRALRHQLAAKARDRGRNG